MKQCPFCGANDPLDFIIQRGTPDREGVPTRVLCDGCGATGPQEYESTEENFMSAANAWNTRQAPARR